MSQTEQLLRYLRRHRTITPLEALRELGIFRLAARIHNLRNEYDIETRLVMDDKAKKAYAEYVYHGRYAK